jgi:hypothetical protein
VSLIAIDVRAMLLQQFEVNDTGTPVAYSGAEISGANLTSDPRDINRDAN